MALPGSWLCQAGAAPGAGDCLQGLGGSAPQVEGLVPRCSVLSPMAWGFTPPTPSQQHGEDAGGAETEGLRVPPAPALTPALRVRGGQGRDGRGCQPAGQGQPGAGFVLKCCAGQIPRGALRCGWRGRFGKGTRARGHACPGRDGPSLPPAPTREELERIRQKGRLAQPPPLPPPRREGAAGPRSLCAPVRAALRGRCAGAGAAATGPAREGLARVGSVMNGLIAAGIFTTAQMTF